MFNKKQFKIFIDSPKNYQVARDLETFHIQSHSINGEWLFQLKNKSLTLTKRIIDSFPIKEDFCEVMESSSILDPISSVHGVQQVFELEKNGIIRIFKKKTMEELKMIQLDYKAEHPIYLKESEDLCSVNKNLSDMLGIAKRYQCKLDYFTGFNNFSLLVNSKGIYLFGTDGLHSLMILLSENSKSKESQTNSYYLTLYQIQMLKLFLECEGSDFNFEVKDNQLFVTSLDSSLILTLEKNDDVNNIELLYPVSDEKGIIFHEDVRQSILDSLSREAIKSYKDENKTKESYEVFIEFDEENIRFNNQIIEKNPLNTLKRRVCAYHMMGFLKGIKGDECYIYTDRLETNQSILYF